MKLQLTCLVTAQQLAVMTARFHALASTELDAKQKELLGQRLQNNLMHRISALADAESLRIRDRPVLSKLAENSFLNELTRLQTSIAYGTQTLQ